MTSLSGRVAVVLGFVIIALVLFLLSIGHGLARCGATTIEVQTGHVAMVSNPDEVAQLIKTAAEAVQATS